MFSELLVYFDCGNTEFGLSETELHQQIAGPSEGQYDADALNSAFGDPEHFGDGLSQPHENIVSVRTGLRVVGI